MKGIDRNSLLIGAAIVIVLMLVYWLVSGIIESRDRERRNEAIVRLNIAKRSHDMTWAYGTAQDSTRLAKMQEFNGWMDSLAKDTL